MGDWGRLSLGLLRRPRNPRGRGAAREGVRGDNGVARLVSFQALHAVGHCAQTAGLSPERALGRAAALLPAARAPCAGAEAGSEGGTPVYKDIPPLRSPLAAPPRDQRTQGRPAHADPRKAGVSQPGRAGLCPRSQHSLGPAAWGSRVLGAGSPGCGEASGCGRCGGQGWGDTGTDCPGSSGDISSHPSKRGVVLTLWAPLRDCWGE